MWIYKNQNIPSTGNKCFDIFGKLLDGKLVDGVQQWKHCDKKKKKTGQNESMCNSNYTSSQKLQKHCVESGKNVEL